MHQPKKQHGWHHLTQKKRDRMEALLDEGETQKEIAKILKVDPGTISRERKRKRRNGRYDADTAEAKAKAKRSFSKRKGMKVEGNTALKAHIIAELQKKRSPDEIAGRMRVEKLSFYAAKNAIYSWLYSAYGQPYTKYLCTKRWHRRKQKNKTGRTMIPNRVSIDKRPLGATNKTRYGHFEGDTIVAPKKVENTEGVAMAAERKTKFLLGTKIPSLSPKHMTQAVDRFEAEANILSFTLDNGIENRDHEQWGIDGYFADPHSPWQKPLVECSIGLLRRWKYPKGTDWATVTEEELQTEIEFLNNKYRKSLGYKSANEMAALHAIIKKSNKNMSRKEIAIG